MSTSGIRAGQAYVELTANDAKLQSGLTAAKAKLAAWGKGATGTLGKLSFGGGGIGGLMGAIPGGGGLAALGGLGIFGAGVAIAAKSLTAYEAARRAEMKLAAVLAATGNTAGMTRKEIVAYADELAELTGIEDDAIVSAAGLLAAFRNVRGDVFKDAIRSAADLSAALGIDLESAVQMVGKALNDPQTGLRGLKSAGVTMDVNGIQAQAAGGDLLGAQREVLAAIRESFGGVAAAMASPFEQLKNTLDNLLEKLGSELLPLMQVLVSDLSVAIKTAGEETSIFGRAFETVADIVQVVWQIVKGLALALQALVTVFVVGVSRMIAATEALGIVSRQTAKEWDSFADRWTADLKRNADQLYKDFLGKTPSERAAMERERQRKRLENFDQRAANATPPPPLVKSLGEISAPAGLVAGSAELVAAQANQDAKAQLEELQRHTELLEDINRKADQWESGSESGGGADFDIPR